jgi:hypothetical protein
MTTKPVYLSPFETIVGVGWRRSGAVALFLIEFNMNATNTNGASPQLDIAMDFEIKDDSASIFAEQTKVRRAGGSTPPIGNTITADMLANYAIWSLPPYVFAGDVVHSTGGGFYFITTNFATFPDFVFSPYSSVAAADAYLQEQLALHPEYAGGTGTIQFLPPFDHTSQDKIWRAAVFVNLSAYALKTDKSLDLTMTYHMSGEGTPSGQFNILGLYFDPGLGLVTTIDPTLNWHSGLGFSGPPLAGYSYHEQGDWSNLTTGVTINVSADFNIGTAPPSITGPASPGGGGG